MSPELSVAVDEVRATFPELSVDTKLNDDGSVWVVVKDVYLGDQWSPDHSSVSFTISTQYPYAECYPHYLEASVKKTDGSPLGDAVHASQRTPQGDEAVMVSQVNRQFSNIPDTAAVKLVKVVDWIRSRP